MGYQSAHTGFCCLSSSPACCRPSFPVSLWPYTLWHVMDCRYAEEPSKMCKVPFDETFGRGALYLKRLHPFGCWALYMPLVRKLSTFGPCLRQGFCIHHDEDNLYWLRIDPSTVCMKQIRFKEYQFPSLMGIKQ